VNFKQNSKNNFRNSGANPKIVSYNVTNSLERFENKNSLFCLKKDLVYYNAGVVVVNLEVVAFALGPLVVM
jgi:hypothetical protein